MAITYDPKHSHYTDEADVRQEMSRVFDVCSGCRRCVELCPTFPTLFEMIDANPDHDAGRLTPAQQDDVVDHCFQCKQCFLNCPYTPELHEWAVDFPRLMLRAEAMRHAHQQLALRTRRTTQVIGHTDLIGRVASRFAPLANRMIGAKPGGLTRTVIERATGVSRLRLLAPFARQRFSTWYKRRPKVRLERRQGSVAVFPTCFVEYQVPGVGHDLVKVYERNGIECSITDGVGCCGAPWLYGGDIDRFTKIAAANVKSLARCVREGKTIVVPQPTCGYILKQDYPAYVGGEDAELVAANTKDACEYLIDVHHAAGTRLDTDFPGEVPATIAYHPPCHLNAQGIGMKSRDLLKLTAARVTAVQGCTATSGMWGLRAENAATSVQMSAKLAAAIDQVGADVVVGDCHLANMAIAEQRGSVPLHPLQVIARAYGIAEETGER